MNDTVSTILILAVVALFEGVRRLPPGAFVLRRVLGGRWNAATPLELGRDWYLVAWPIPVVIPVIIARNAREDSIGINRHVRRMRTRERRTRRVRIVLRVWGTLILLGLVVGVPLATLRWDVFGLVASVATLFLLCFVQAFLTYIGLRRSGTSRRDSVIPAMKMIWPFSAPCAAEVVQQQVVRSAPWILALVELLGREQFFAEMRPMLYDEYRGGNVNGVVGALYGREAIAEFLRTPSDGTANPFCPRCGAQYRANVKECVDCTDVVLLSGSERDPSREREAKS